MQELGHLKEIRSLELNDPNALGNIVIHDITDDVLGAAVQNG